MSIGYFDSDLADYMDIRKSTFSYVLKLPGGAISWKTATQTLIAQSIMEIEFIACYEASNHAMVEEICNMIAVC